MKRKFALIVTVSLLIMATSIVSVSAIVTGDVNRDNKVTIDDASQIQRYISSQATLDNEQYQNADVDSNGKIEIRDVTYIQKYLTNNFTTFPVDINPTEKTTTSTISPTDTTEQTTITNIPTEVTVKIDGTGDFSTLKEAIAYSTLHKDLTINVYKGTYDLIEEFGDEYFENLIGPNQRQGLQIGNGVHLIFLSGAKVVCNYEGDNEAVKTLFSPFNFAQGTSGFTLENLNLECSNVRYAIHDEAGGVSRTPNMYKNTYKNCKIAIDNTNNTNWKHHQCIGGGLGVYGEINIENCHFIDNTEKTSTSPVGVVSYHNNISEGAKSKIVVTGCYFSDYSTFRLSYYGNSTEITEAYVSNCSMTHEPYVTAETSDYSIVNVEIIQSDNIIRDIK